MAPLRRLFSRSAVQFGMRFGTRMNAGASLKRPLLSRWPAAFIAAVLIGTTALVLYVEASVSKLKQVLPVEDRKRVVSGTGVSVRGDFCGVRINKNNNINTKIEKTT